jgi:hypothetical protein
MTTRAERWNAENPTLPTGKQITFLQALVIGKGLATYENFQEVISKMNLTTRREYSDKISELQRMPDRGPARAES